jgi:hypothetical protein
MARRARVDVDRRQPDRLVTNPGRWMAHRHIAEHHESGMMFSFDVAPADGDGNYVADR